MKLNYCIIANLFWTAFGLPIATKNINPEETAGLFEGDILGDPYIARNGYFNRKWPGGMVPYSIDFVYPIAELTALNIAIERINRKTCIKLRKKTNEDKDWLSIVGDGTGCSSYIGKIGGKQTLSLQTNGCLYGIGIAIHEFIHAVGFAHEQSRFDRDDYVTVMWENIMEDQKRNFEKVLQNETSSYGVAYDYGSIMHYRADTFSKNGKPTLVPKKENVTIGQRYDLSEGDIKKINAMYNCSTAL